MLNYFGRLDPRQLTARETFVIWTEIPKIKARRELEFRIASAPLSPERIFDLVSLAVNKEKAIEAENNLILEIARGSK